MITPDFSVWAARLGAWSRKLQPPTAAYPQLHQLALLFAPFIAAQDLQPTSRQACSRVRQWPKALIFWTFLAQVLSPGKACRWAIRQAQAQAFAQGTRPPSAATSPYCQARGRFKLEWLQALIGQVRDQLCQKVPATSLWLGRSVKVIDGTTVDLPDTPANQRAYPQPASQQPGLGFPLLRVNALFCLASGALLSYLSGPFGQSELVLATGLLQQLLPKDVLLADRLYGCYRWLCLVQGRQADALCRLHASRKVDFRRARRLAKHDGLFVWQRPRNVPRDYTRTQWLALPAQLTVRLVRYAIKQPGFRTRRVTLVTTLLDPKAYPAEALAQLYQRRWQVELSFHQIKTLLQMESLSTLSPAMVHKELAMHLLAYQLIRAVMQAAALRWDTPLAGLSFQGSLDALEHFAAAMLGSRSQKKRSALYAQLLRQIAQDPVRPRPNRREPRALKRRLKNFQRLTRPRHQFKDTPHQSKVLSRRAKKRMA